MAGKQAKTLKEKPQGSPCLCPRTRDTGSKSSHSDAVRRLRACEIAKLAWGMMLGTDGDVGTMIELQDYAAKSEAAFAFLFTQILGAF